MVLFFKDCQFTIDFTSKHFPYKRKQEIRRRIVDHGGTISYILNDKVCAKFHLVLNCRLSIAKARKYCSFMSMLSGETLE